MKRLIIVGSPRANGRSARLAEMLFEACIDECPEDELYLAPVSELEIAPCVACDACRKAGERAAQAKLGDLGEADASDAAVSVGSGVDGEDALPISYCPRFDDDMLELYDVLSDADELVVVSPVFWSGPPAPLCALLDRMQPYFWEWMALRSSGADGAAKAAEKRPATLHVIGEGLDKNGYIALVGKVRSALAPAGFQLERVLDWVGRIDADGTIQGEAVEYEVAPLGAPLVAPETYLQPVGAQVDPQSVGAGSHRALQNDEAGSRSAEHGASAQSARSAAGSTRPKLSLAGEKRAGSSNASGARKGGAPKGGPRNAERAKGSSSRGGSRFGGSPQGAKGAKGGRGGRNNKSGRRNG